jgi:hypothetical protein
LEHCFPRDETSLTPAEISRLFLSVYCLILSFDKRNVAAGVTDPIAELGGCDRGGEAMEARSHKTQAAWPQRDSTACNRAMNLIEQKLFAWVQQRI